MRKIYGYVYKVTFQRTGKVYVGKTTLSLKARWRDHCRLATKSSSSYLHRAIRKHGKELFICEQVCFTFSESRLNFLERYWIKKLNAAHPYGYNLQSGGEGGKHHAITKRKMSRSAKEACARPDVIKKRKETFASPAYREKLSQSITESWAKPALREKQSKRMKRVWKGAAYRSNQERMWKDPKFLRKHSRRTKAQWKNIKDVDSFKLKLKAAWDRPGYREQMKALRKAEWESPEFKRRMIASFQAPKTKKRKSVASKNHWALPGARERYSAAMRAAHARKRALLEDTR